MRLPTRPRWSSPRRNKAGASWAWWTAFSPKGVEDEEDIKWRKDFLRQIGYKR